MAIFNEAQYVDVIKTIDQCASPWLLIGYQKTESIAESMQGFLGIVDWRLHGQVSSLIKDDKIKPNELAMVPSNAQLGKASLLLFYVSQKNPKNLLEHLLKLKVNDVCIVQNSFPEDFLENLQQNLSKAGIKWNMLEKTL